MAKVGRPPKYNSKFHPEDFIKQSKTGKHLYQIAASWDIARETLWEWTKSHSEFSNAVKKGQELAEAWYMQTGMNAMLGDQQINVGMFVYLTKNKFRWSDKQEPEKSNVVKREEPQESYTEEELEKKCGNA